MQYPLEALKELARGLDEIPSQLQQLQMDCFLSCNDIPNERVKEYMFHGVGRRLNVLRHTIINVFGHFPPSTEESSTEMFSLMYRLICKHSLST